MAHTSRDEIAFTYTPGFEDGESRNATTVVTSYTTLQLPTGTRQNRRLFGAAPASARTQKNGFAMFCERFTWPVARVDMVRCYLHLLDAISIRWFHARMQNSARACGERWVPPFARRIMV